LGSFDVSHALLLSLKNNKKALRMKRYLVVCFGLFFPFCLGGLCVEGVEQDLRDATDQGNFYFQFLSDRVLLLNCNGTNELLDSRYTWVSPILETSLTGKAVCIEISS
jgi:hypothetical protein